MHSEIEKRMSYVRRSSTEPQPSSEEPERKPRKGDKTGQGPWTTRNYAGSVRTQENVRSRHFRTRTLRTELQSLKGIDGQIENVKKRKLISLCFLTSVYKHYKVTKAKSV